MKIKVYTDGACSDNPGPGGWGAIFLLDDELKSISGHESKTTNNRMELMAIVETLRTIVNELYENTGCKLYELYSDSAYVVNSVNGGWINRWLFNGWKTTRGEDIKNKDLWKEYIQYVEECMDKNIIVKLTKVKGHSGDTFNEYVDELAKKEVLLARKGVKSK
jgi:ribonuclease HI